MERAVSSRFVVKREIVTLLFVVVALFARTPFD
jgi:hypothetical protein